MDSISDKDFDKMISKCLDELPQKYISGLKNIAIVYADEPSKLQRERLSLRGNQTLLGLFEGIPNTKKAESQSIFNPNNTVLPDKITLFKIPLLASSSDLNAFKKQVKHTLWHEIAHYYGLDHDRIHKIEKKL